MPSIGGRKFIFPVLCVCFLILYTVSLYHRVLDIDDPWLAELSYFISKLGYARSTLWTGINGYEVIDVNYHKLLVLLGALSIKIFGLSPYILKSISLMFLFVFAFALHRYFEDRKQDFTRRDFWISLFLLWSTSLVFFYSFVFRPEIAVMGIGFWAFYFFRKSLLESKLFGMAVAGFLFGLGMAFHLKGSVYIFAAGAYLVIFQRQIKPLLVFIPSAVLGVLPYFWDITSWERLATFRTQFANNPVIVRVPHTIWGYLLKPLEEHKRFFHQEHEIVFSLLFFVALIFYFKPLKKLLDVELKFLLLTVLATGLTSHNMSDKALLLYYPFMVLVVVAALKLMPPKNKVIPVLLALSLVVNTLVNFRVIYGMTPVAARSEMAAVQIGKKNIKVMADLSFVFNQIQNYEIYAASNYTFRCVYTTHEKPTMEKYFEYVDQFGVEYIILDTMTMTGEEEELFKDVDLSEGSMVRNFRVKFNRQGITVLERVAS